MYTSDADEVKGKATVDRKGALCYRYSTGPGIYGSKPTRVRGRSPRTRAVYVAINPWQLCYNYYISHLIG